MKNYNTILLLQAIWPAIGLLTTLLLPAKAERKISTLAWWTVGIHFILTALLVAIWLTNSRTHLGGPEWVIFESGTYRFYIDFYVDNVTAFFALTGSSITLLILRFSRYYMHMEQGFKRFFSVILLFYFGYNWTILSGNFETLFLGWEILGISSFLLIAFYRHRYQPVKNAVKVFTIYRLGDIGILAAMWASHHLWHANVRFSTLANENLVRSHAIDHPYIAIFIGIALLIAAAAKSAQLPFSTWLPRAMEGPTPSSAIFYGALSVHFGVFLLLRTYPFWGDQWLTKGLVMAVGFATALVSYAISSVQPTIKSRIAYASITQIGIIFIEVALGWEWMALWHMAGNAFLRSYQLLISPSIVNNLIREQFFNRPWRKEPKHNRLYTTLYMLSIQEWKLDYWLNQHVFGTIKKVGKSLKRLQLKTLLALWIPFYLIGLWMYYNLDQLPGWLSAIMPVVLVATGLFLTAKAFAERKQPRLAWTMVCLNHATLTLGVSYNDHLDFTQTLIYLSGVATSGLLGFLVLLRLKRKLQEKHYGLNRYYGHITKFPIEAFLFLLATLGLMGFPITPTFLGEDLLFSHIHIHQFLLGALVAAGFIISGMALIRIYARIFLGPPIEPTTSNPLMSA
jgi:NADH-quinone oxidoreductase subunit L